MTDAHDDPSLGLNNLRAWCRREQFHPDRTAGQNFLVDLNVRDRIVEAAGIRPGMPVVEIGPGLGALTGRLLAGGVKLTAIEKDARLARFLRRRWAGHAGLTLVEGDAMEVDLDRLLGPGVDLLLSNLPFAAGTRILIRWLRHPAAPRRMVVTLQREVAERLVAGPGSRTRGLAGVWTQRYYQARVARHISAGCFWPKPAVESSLVLLERHDNCHLDPRQGEVFDYMTRYSFMHRRKQMRSIWRYAPHPFGTDDRLLLPRFAEAGIKAEARPEMLDLQQWRRLACLWSAALSEDHPVHGGAIKDFDL